MLSPKSAGVPWAAGYEGLEFRKGVQTRCKVRTHEDGHWLQKCNKVPGEWAEWGQLRWQWPLEGTLPSLYNLSDSLIPRLLIQALTPCLLLSFPERKHIILCTFIHLLIPSMNIQLFQNQISTGPNSCMIAAAWNLSLPYPTIQIGYASITIWPGSLFPLGTVSGVDQAPL